MKIQIWELVECGREWRRKLRLLRGYLSHLRRESAIEIDGEIGGGLREEKWRVEIEVEV